METRRRSVSQLQGLGLVLAVVAMAACGLPVSPAEGADPLLAGVGKVDITNREAGPVNDPLFARALVLKQGDTACVLVSLDVVSVGEIGYVKNDYLGNVRAAVTRELGIPGKQLIVNASHCHGVPCVDIELRTVQAIKQAWANVVPVVAGVGTGFEDRVMENRRLKLKSGREADVRHAYSLPPDEEVAEVGPVDPEIGVLRLDRLDGQTLAVVYNFACHPIQGVPSRGNTADMTGFSSRAIEDNLDPGAVALFVQGCGGDINPVTYKDTSTPRDAETLGNLLGLSTLRAVRQIKTEPAPRLTVVNESLTLPRADLAPRIAALEERRDTLVRSLGGTSLNLKTFLPLVVKYNLAEEFPSYYSHRYLHEKSRGRDGLAQLDAENRRNMEAYIRNIYTMEELTRVQTNLALLKKHQLQNVEAGSRTIDVEVAAIRVGPFVLVTFPGELTVQIGLNIKQKSPFPSTFVAGYTNGYIYYTPTAEQLKNVGGAQEDSDCILAPEWQELFEARVAKILAGLK